MVYSALVMNANNTYEDVLCNDISALEDAQGDIMTCVIDTVVLMSEPFNFYYGDKVSAKIEGSNQDGTLISEIGVSESAIAPYITGQVEFGFHSHLYYPFDEENGVYPTTENLVNMDLSSNLNLTTIRILERISSKGTHHLHGI